MILDVICIRKTISPWTSNLLVSCDLNNPDLFTETNDTYLFTGQTVDRHPTLRLKQRPKTSSLS